MDLYKTAFECNVFTIYWITNNIIEPAFVQSLKKVSGDIIILSSLWGQLKKSHACGNLDAHFFSGRKVSSYTNVTFRQLKICNISKPMEYVLPR